MPYTDDEIDNAEANMEAQAQTIVANLAVGGVANPINLDNQSTINMNTLFRIKSLLDEVSRFVTAGVARIDRWLTDLDLDLGVAEDRVDQARELGLEDDTLVLFSGDNGGADYFKSKEHPRGFHGANVDPKTGVEFRGKKGNLFEGGLRVPFLMSWPARLPQGVTYDLPTNENDLTLERVEMDGRVNIDRNLVGDRRRIPTVGRHLRLVLQCRECKRRE